MEPGVGEVRPAVILQRGERGSRLDASDAGVRGRRDDRDDLLAVAFVGRAEHYCVPRSPERSLSTASTSANTSSCSAFGRSMPSVDAPGPSPPEARPASSGSSRGSVPRNRLRRPRPLTTRVDRADITRVRGQSGNDFDDDLRPAPGTGAVRPRHRGRVPLGSTHKDPDRSALTFVEDPRAESPLVVRPATWRPKSTPTANHQPRARVGVHQHRR